MNTKELSDVVVALQAKVAELETAISEIKPRDRGPRSSRTMTEDDAKRVRFGDLKALSHKAAAEALNLSYGQIYSAREGFTFKNIKETPVAA